MALVSQDSGAKRISKILLQALVGGMVGAGIGYASMSTLDRMDENALDNLHIGAFTVAIILVIIGVISLAISLSARLVRQGFDIDPDEPDIRLERRALILQGIVLLVSGAVMMIPALGPEVLPIGRTPAIMLILVLVVIESAINWMIYREGDEFARRVMAECCVLSFWIVQMALFLWASAEVFGLAPKASALDMITALMVVYLLSIGVVSVRRGMVKQG